MINIQPLLRCTQEAISSSLISWLSRKNTVPPLGQQTNNTGREAKGQHHPCFKPFLAIELWMYFLLKEILRILTTLILILLARHLRLEAGFRK